MKEYNNYLLEVFKISKDPKFTFRILSEFNNTQTNTLGYVYFHNNIINILSKDALKSLNYSKNSSNINKLFKETVLHEYTHALINHKFIENNTLPKKLPFWFNEGVAEYIGRITTGKAIPKFIFKDITTDDLDELFKKESDKFYEYSCIFISYLIDNYGLQIIPTIIDNLKYDNFESTVKEITGKTLFELSKEVFIPLK